MPLDTPLRRLEEFAKAYGCRWRRNGAKAGLEFRDGQDERRVRIDLATVDSMKSFLDEFRRLDLARTSVLEAISLTAVAKGGSIDRDPEGWTIHTGDGCDVFPLVDWRLTRRLERESSEAVLCHWLKSYHIDRKASLESARKILAGVPPESSEPVPVSLSRLVAEGMAPGLVDTLSRARQKLDEALAEGNLDHGDHAELVAQLQNADQRLDDMDREFAEIFRDDSPEGHDPFELSRLLADFEPRHEVRRDIAPLETDFDLILCDRWAMETIRSMRAKPSPGWRRDPWLWVPSIDTWMTEDHWRGWAETWLAGHPGSWSTEVAAILLGPEAKPEHRACARRWIEAWMAEGGYDADCFEEILVPFLEEIDGLEDLLEIQGRSTMVKAWNAGDKRWEKNLRDAVLGQDPIDPEALRHGGMVREFWEELFSPEELDGIRQHLLGWTRTEPVWNLRHSLVANLQLAAVMGWSEVARSLAERDFLPHHLGSLDAPIEDLQRDSRLLLDAFQHHLESLTGRDRLADARAIDRLRSSMDTSYAHTEPPSALVCTLFPEFRDLTLPLFARAIVPFAQGNQPITPFADTWTLAVGWSRLRPRETLES